MLRLPILSVLALWSLLGVIAGGLLLIVKALEHVRRNLEQIAMGVRAIEQQTKPLGPGGELLAVSLGGAGDGVVAVTRELNQAERNLAAATPALESRPRR